MKAFQRWRDSVQKAATTIRAAVFSRRAQQQLPRLYREMHKKGLFIGETWKNSYELFAASIPNLHDCRILDFGCGPRGGLGELLGEGQVISYDPYIGRYSRPPWDQPFDVLFSTDVLEHLPRAEISDFAERVLACFPKFIFLNISTRAADKKFSNGANVHVTVKPTSWWIATLNRFWSKNYTCAVVRDEPDECTLLFKARNEDRSEA
jgi:hypothetical protein